MTLLAGGSFLGALAKMTRKPKTSSRVNPDLSPVDVCAENGKRLVDVCAGKRETLGRCLRWKTSRRPCCCCPPRGSFTSRCLDTAALRALFPTHPIPGSRYLISENAFDLYVHPSPLKSSPGRADRDGKKSANGICVGTRINESSS